MPKMPRGELSPDEETAGQIVAQQVGGVPVARDVPGAEDGTHDIDIALPDRTRIPLEVTSAGDQAIESLRWEALGRVWEAPALGHHWWIGLPLDGTVKVRQLMSKVIPHLEVLDRHGVEQIGGALRAKLPADLDEEAADGAKAVLALGIRRATRIDPPKPGEAARVLASLGGSAGSNFDLMNDLVAECAQKKVNKLAAAAGAERHLFVWIRSSASDAELAIATLPPPVAAPTLPTEIDVVWVATAGVADQPYGKLLRLQPPGEWEDIPTDATGRRWLERKPQTTITAALQTSMPEMDPK
jgi:hypothetical protein